ncbi:DUF2075 domain-containing protein [bacterium]|nr:DUF2075 domain-containing protein [bacterium]
MIVYKRTIHDFLLDADSGNLADTVLAELYQKTGRRVGASEQSSWHHSLGQMAGVLDKAGLPENNWVGVEYGIPRTSNRIDFLISGTDDAGREKIVLVELKQWTKAEPTGEEAIVRTFLGRGVRDTPHPSYQAWSYAELLKGYNEAIYTGDIGLEPCAYLHNYQDDGVLRGPDYEVYVERAPLFYKTDRQLLRQFLQRHVRHQSRRDVLYEIEHGAIRPSKELADRVASMLKGNEEFVLIDAQKVAFERAVNLALKAQANPKKKVLIVHGGPGTGKSVIAVQLLARLTQKGQVVQYVSKNAAPRAVFESKLTGSFKKSAISNLFRGSGSFHQSAEETFGTLIVDEAHRLNEKSGLYGNEGDNQIKELIRAARCTVFFLDEDQRIHLKDIGSRDEIVHWAHYFDTEVQEMELTSQFRCGGSDGYMAWLDDVLGIRPTANPYLDDTHYDFQVFDDPNALREAIEAKNKERNSARLVAGYCWDWKSKRDPSAFDIVAPEFDFAMQWNMADDGSLWMIKPNSVTEVGCIHTCQGLELDYVGVILGPDLVMGPDGPESRVEGRSKMDQTVKGWKKMSLENPIETREKVDLIIRNTYRTLMSRGMKGCYVWCADPELGAFLKWRVKSVFLM